MPSVGGQTSRRRAAAGEVAGYPRAGATETLAAPPAGAARLAVLRCDPPVALTCWVPLVLLLDRDATIWSQRALGVGTWLLLLALLRRESPLVRAQVAVVVVFATAVEYTFSPLLEVYVYRLGNVPAFVPPGHGLVYLCALAIGRAAWVHRRTPRRWSRRPCSPAACTPGGDCSSRPGPTRSALSGTSACSASWRGAGRRTLYVGAFLVVTYLELLGTGLGTWAWQTHDPTGLVTIGNPPSGAAGGYGWFDLAAVLAGPAVLTLTYRLRAAAPARRPPAAAESTT